MFRPLNFDHVLVSGQKNRGRKSGSGVRSAVSCETS